ncbi:hypothetical protein E2C01_000857 [Portunus trituberculatus]|uniref:Uncharacterized protein n=1 Tax=Portunus trituberculatus TaxID=210409 RepID=A0A5B7CIR6_PORTR|nr:hypothetical protein [Portunus trituberculatus]
MCCRPAVSLQLTVRRTFHRRPLQHYEEGVEYQESGEPVPRAASCVLSPLCLRDKAFICPFSSLDRDSHGLRFCFPPFEPCD